MHLARLTRYVFVVTDAVGTITYVNQATRLFHGDQKFIGRPVADFAEPKSWAAFTERVLAGETSVESRILGVADDGSLTPLSLRTVYDPDTERWYTIERDISELVDREEQEKRLVSDLRYQAMTDSLTGLANRAAFRGAVEDAISERSRFAMLMLDMDDFKSVNDTMGHSVGDKLLIEMGARLVLLTFGVDYDQLAAIAERVLSRLSKSLTIDGRSIQRSCSIGGAVWDQDENYSEIMLRADSTAYAAKHAGRSRFSFS